MALPVDIGKMVTLQHLDLSCNSLPDLPKDFTNLKNLRHLNLHQNELKELPKGVCGGEGCPKVWGGGRGGLPNTLHSVCGECVGVFVCDVCVCTIAIGLVMFEYTGHTRVVS